MQRQNYTRAILCYERTRLATTLTMHNGLPIKWKTILYTCNAAFLAAGKDVILHGRSVHSTGGGRLVESMGRGPSRT